MLLAAAAAAVALLAVVGPATGGALPGAGAGAAGAGVPGVSEAPWGAWVAETASSEFVLDRTSLELDGDGRAVIGYWGHEGSHPGEAAYVEQTALGGWQRHAVYRPAQFHDMALGPDGRVHMIFENLSVTYQNGGHPLTYAVQDGGGGWMMEQVTDFGESVSLAVGSDGSVHVTVGTADSLHYFRRDGGEWPGPKVSDNGFWQDLVLDRGNDPHIAFGTNEGPGGTLAYATKEDGSWTVDTQVLSECGITPSITVDGQDQPHMACNYVDGLAYVWRDALGWHHEVADDGSGVVFDRDPGKVGGDTSIVLDSDGEPHISYRYEPAFGASHVFPGKPHYASKVDGEWVVETIDHDGEDSGKATSIELDDGGRPHVSHVRGQRFQDGFPGSQQLSASWDVRYARPLQGEAPPAPGS